MFSFLRDPGADGVGVAFTDAVAPDGGVLTLGGAFGSGAPAPGIDLVESHLGIQLATVRQVHGATVVRATSRPAQTRDCEADALVTDRPLIGLTVRVADCVPVLLADPVARLVGAAHAGRVGLAAGVLQRVTSQLRTLGATALRAWIGPHICGACYEVPDAMAADVAAIVPAVACRTRKGTAGLDLGAGATAVLASEGVDVVRVDRCTLEDTSLHSYRRDGTAAGRQAGIIWLAADH